MITVDHNVRPMVGDLFASEAQTLVNTVNCVGIMGKGIALGFKQRFPDMFKDYVVRCERGEVRLGRPYLWTPMFPPWVLNFPTKDHWRSGAHLDAIVAGLEYLEANYGEWGVTSLAVPPLGCGEGGLEWRVVGPTLYRHLARLAIPVELYAPFGTPPEMLDLGFLGAGPLPGSPLSLRLTPAAVAVAVIIESLNQQPYRSPTGRVVVQKIAYFATESGIPTGLTYEEGSFGPYSPAAKEMVRKLVNNGVLAEQTIGQAIIAVPGPTIADAKAQYANDLAGWSDQIDRVMDLFMRLRSSRQAEVAATVHFAASVLRKAAGTAPSELDVLAYARQWKVRRQPPVTDQEFALAIRNLSALGWLDVLTSDDLPLP